MVAVHRLELRLSVRAMAGRSLAAAEETMADLTFVGITVLFFVVTVAYVKFCDSVK
jgi:hypothetical protein